ncbi:39S ribosomal protein L17, mitochondrial [Nymphon striatum]|nr:39S ribosomal protein L17, mitochondrial [Nymphon striatum]
MTLSEITRLVPKLRIKIKHEPRNYANPGGPLGRLKIMRRVLNGLIEHERVEMAYIKASETRGYAERLISEAIRHGDCHKPTMELANFWLEDKRLIHKLFKVLVPRYENYNLSYTKLHVLPMYYEERSIEPSRSRRHAHQMLGCLELRNNPYPPIKPQEVDNRKWIHNVLIDEAKKEYKMEKYKDALKKWSEEDPEAAKQALNFPNELSQQPRTDK